MSERVVDIDDNDNDDGNDDNEVDDNDDDGDDDDDDNDDDDDGMAYGSAFVGPHPTWSALIRKGNGGGASS